IGIIELNEAFAAQSLAVIREAKMDIDKVNVNGGAIALGHPIGATGAVLMTKLLHEMERRQEKYGLVTLCIGVGQGISTIVEYLDYNDEINSSSSSVLLSITKKLYEKDGFNCEMYIFFNYYLCIILKEKKC